MDKRKFLKLSFKFSLFTFALAIFGCSKTATTANDGDDTADGSCDSGAVTTYTNPGHAHSVVNLTIAEILAADTGISYTLMTGGHSHIISLTAADFTNLQNGNLVSKTEPSHGHLLTLQC